MRFLDFRGCESYDALMMSRVLIGLVLLTAGAGLAQAQSLADVARTEAARRKAVDAPGRVYTNGDLRTDVSKAVPPAPAAGTPSEATQQAATTPAAATGTAPAPAAQGGEVRDQAYWSSRMADARATLDRNQAFAQALQNRIDMLWTDFVNRGDPVQQRAIEQDRNRALAELDSLKKDIASNQQAITDIENEARRAGVPAGWLRR
jgi:hypothetical protein